MSSKQKRIANNGKFKSKLRKATGKCLNVIKMKKINMKIVNYLK